MSNTTRVVGDRFWRGSGKATKALAAVAEEIAASKAVIVKGIDSTVSTLSALLRRWVNPQTAAIAVVATLGVVEPSFAGGGGFSQITSVANNVQTMLVATSIIAVTIAIMIAGYKIAFAGARFQDVWGILLGGTLIGGAAGLAAWIAAPQ